MNFIVPVTRIRGPHSTSHRIGAEDEQFAVNDETSYKEDHEISEQEHSASRDIEYADIDSINADSSDSMAKIIVST